MKGQTYGNVMKVIGILECMSYSGECECLKELIYTAIDLLSDAVKEDMPWFIKDELELNNEKN